MKLKLTWTQERPAKKGCFLMVSEYGNEIGIIFTTGAKDHPPLLHTTQGLMDVGGYWFAEFDAEATFSIEMMASIKGAVADLPRRRLERAEDWLRQHPKSPKAKAAVEEARAGMSA